MIFHPEYSARSSRGRFKTVLNHDLILMALTNASAGHGEDPFNWMFVFKHAVNLVLLLGLIIYLIKTPFLNYLKKRKENLSSEIDEAKKAIEDAKKKHEEYSAKLDNLQNEINSLKENIKKQGQREKEELIKQAQYSCELIKNEVKDTVELETYRARQQLQTEVVNSSLELAENMIKQNMQGNHTSDAVNDLVKIIEEGKWQQSQH